MPVGDPGPFDPELTTLRLGPSRIGSSRRAIALAAAAVLLVVAGATTVALRRTSGSAASDPGLVPVGAMALPESTGLHVRWAGQTLPAVSSRLGWYATAGEHPELRTYLRIVTFENSVPEATLLTCPLAEAARDVTLPDGSPACLAERPSSEAFGRIFVDQSPFAVIIEGTVDDDALIDAAEHLELDPVSGWGRFIGAAGLPPGVVETGRGWTVSDFASTATDVTTQPMVQINWGDAGGRSVFYVATADGPDFVTNLRLRHETITDVSVRGTAGFLRTIRGDSGYLGVVWREHGVTYQVGSQQLTESELLGLVEELRPATPDEWAAMVAVEPGAGAVDTLSTSPPTTA
jgi:hypothetical protein